MGLSAAARASKPDPAERAAKNALMQRVNRAYEANDLLVLLEL